MQVEFSESRIGDPNLRQEALTALEDRLGTEKPDLLPAIQAVKERLGEAAFHRAFDDVENINRREGDLLIVAHNVLSRSFIERDAIPVLKDAFGVQRVRVVG